MFSLTDYTYTLPEELIAQTPVFPPEQARLLVYNRATKQIQDKHFFDLLDLLPKNTLIVFNDSKVVKARLLFPELNGELLFLRLLTPTSCEALVRPGKKRPIGMTHTLANSTISFTVTWITPHGRIVSCSQPRLSVLEQYGQMPLPPYITYDPAVSDTYQPIVANHEKPWSVAAPTAALHFSAQLLQQLQDAWHNTETVTLHVWLGTFKTVDVEDITTYVIHQESCEVTYQLFTRLMQQKQRHHPVLAIWTTSTRTLESLPYLRAQLTNEQKRTIAPPETIAYRDNLTVGITPAAGTQYISEIMLHDDRLTFNSQLYIFPWFQFRLIDQLITNFHLPKSSLLMLVAWYIGYEPMQQIYQHGVTKKYRFFSFWDGMLLG